MYEFEHIPTPTTMYEFEHILTPTMLEVTRKLADPREHKHWREMVFGKNSKLCRISEERIPPIMCVECDPLPCSDTHKRYSCGYCTNWWSCVVEQVLQHIMERHVVVTKFILRSPRDSIPDVARSKVYPFLKGKELISQVYQCLHKIGPESLVLSSQLHFPPPPACYGCEFADYYTRSRITQCHNCIKNNVPSKKSFNTLSIAYLSLQQGKGKKNKVYNMCCWCKYCNVNNSAKMLEHLRDHLSKRYTDSLL